MQEAGGDERGAARYSIAISECEPSEKMLDSYLAVICRDANAVYFKNLLQD
jgi:hypothetical protein